MSSCDAFGNTVPDASDSAAFLGFVATYYDDASLTPSSAVTARQLSGSNIDWAASGIASLTNDDSFSVRWHGYVRPSIAGLWTFTTRVLDNDDRVRLWVNDALLVNQWSSLTTLTPSAATTFAVGGDYYQVRMEFKEQAGAQGIQLLWETGGKQEVIPSHRLFAPFAAVAGAEATVHIAPCKGEGKWGYRQRKSDNSSEEFFVFGDDKSFLWRKRNEILVVWLLICDVLIFSVSKEKNLNQISLLQMQAAPGCVLPMWRSTLHSQVSLQRLLVDRQQERFLTLQLEQDDSALVLLSVGTPSQVVHLH